MLIQKIKYLGIIGIFDFFFNIITILLAHYLLKQIESIKALENKTSMAFNSAFANNPILLCFLFFFLIIHLYFLILAAVAQIFIAAAELAKPAGIG